MVQKKRGGNHIEVTFTQSFEKSIVNTLASIHYYVFCQVDEMRGESAFNVHKDGVRDREYFGKKKLSH